MNDNADQQEQRVPEPQLSRKQLRDKLLGARHKPRSKTLTLFNCEVELRQPTLKSIMAARQQEPDKAAVDMIIRYCYVPGTDEQLFEETDRATIENWPFGEDMVALNTAIADLTGVDISAQEQEIQSDPLSE